MVHGIRSTETLSEWDCSPEAYQGTKHRCMHPQIYTWVHMRARTHSHTRTHARTHTHTHTHMHPRMHAYTHTQHACLHAHLSMPFLSLVPPSQTISFPLCDMLKFCLPWSHSSRLTFSLSLIPNTSNFSSLPQANLSVYSVCFLLCSLHSCLVTFSESSLLVCPSLSFVQPFTFGSVCIVICPIVLIRCST